MVLVIVGLLFGLTMIGYFFYDTIQTYGREVIKPSTFVKAIVELWKGN